MNRGAKKNIFSIFLGIRWAICILVRNSHRQSSGNREASGETPDGIRRAE